MSFCYEISYIIDGSINEIYSRRLEGYYGKNTYIDHKIIENVDSDVLLHSKSYILKLNFNPYLLSLINCHQIKIWHIYYKKEEKLITKTKSPKYLANFFDFEEEHIYEQLYDDQGNITNKIKITQKCNGINKINDWLVGPLYYMVPGSEVTKVLTDYKKLQKKLINDEFFF